MIHELEHLITDPAHWIFEGITDMVWTGAVLLAGRVPFRRWVKRHDREEHGHDEPVPGREG